MELKEIFLRLKQRTNSISQNPLLNSFEQDSLILIDQRSLTYSFIAEKKKNILNLIKGIDIDFKPKLKSAFDEYSEALLYLLLKEKFEIVDRIPEANNKTPDFKVSFSDSKLNEDYSLYLELKTMSFASGNLNYKEVLEKGLEAQIDIENQIKNGNRVGFGITEIRPLYSSNKKYDPFSMKYTIEVLIEKIEQNIKKGQFESGETVLVIDMKQLVLPSHFIENSIPVYQEKFNKSFVSGVLWNVAFGKQGHLIYKPIEFEGKENIDGELENNGILINREWIKSIVFLDYSLSSKKPKIIGMHLQNGMSNSINSFLYKFCDFVNDDMNTNGYEINYK